MVLRIQELLWLCLDPIPHLVPLFEMRFLLLFTLVLYTVFFLQLSENLLLPKGLAHNGSFSEWFTPLEALCKYLKFLHGVLCLRLSICPSQSVHAYRAEGTRCVFLLIRLCLPISLCLSLSIFVGISLSVCLSVFTF